MSKKTKNVVFWSVYVSLMIGAAALLYGCGDPAPQAPATLGGSAPVVAAPAPTSGIVTPQTAGQIVFSAKSATLAALMVVAEYRNLPECKAGLIICKDAGVEKHLQALSNAAVAALNEAERAVRTPGFAEDGVVTLVTSARAAVTALTTITQALKTK